MANTKKTRNGRTLKIENALEWAMGWNDYLAGAPFREITSGRMNYDIGRLYAAESKAAGLPVKPWKIRVTKSSKTTKVPDFVWGIPEIGCSPIPPRHIACPRPIPVTAGIY